MNLSREGSAIRGFSAVVPATLHGSVCSCCEIHVERRTSGWQFEFWYWRPETIELQPDRIWAVPIEFARQSPQTSENNRWRQFEHFSEAFQGRNRRELSCNSVGKFVLGAHGKKFFFFFFSIIKTIKLFLSSVHNIRPQFHKQNYKPKLLMTRETNDKFV